MRTGAGHGGSTVEYVLGIDVGTSGTKSALFTRDGKLVDLAYQSYRIDYPGEGRAEQETGDWWNGLVQTAGLVVRRNDAGDGVAALSLSTQGGCTVLMDGSFTPVYPAISWMDRRAGEVSLQLQEEIGVDELYRVCGWSVVDSLCFPTLYWFRKKRPRVLDGVRYFGSTIDYLNYRLTGRFAIDYTNLALTGFLDLENRGHSDRTLAIVGLARKNLSEIVPSGAVIGRIREDAARLLGLSRRPVVVSGAHDRYCESIGAGAVGPGDCVLGAGTSWVLLAISDGLLFGDTGTDGGFIRSIFPGIHPVENRFGLMTVVPYGGNSLKWFRDVMRPGCPFEKLNEDASKIPAGSDGLLFFPISSSARGKGGFLNVDAVHTMGHFTRAVFEGVALMNRAHFDLFGEVGAGVKSLTMIGGGAAGVLWPRIVADVCGVSVRVPESREAACAGAGVLAAFGGGLADSIEEGSRLFAGPGETVRPEPDETRLYGDLYENYMDMIGRI